MPYLKKENGDLFYEVSGTGEAIVLIRGLGRWSEHWCGWQDELSKYYKVIVFDGRGLGRSSLPIGMLDTIGDLAADVRAILETEKISSAHLFGVSLGGMIAMQFAIDYPQFTKSITIVNSSIGRSGHMRITPAAIKVLLSFPKSKSATEQKFQTFYRSLARVLMSPNAVDEKVKTFAKKWQEIDKKYKFPLKTVGAQIILALRWMNWENLSKISCPAIIISCGGDQFVPVANSLFIHSKIPNSKLIKIPYAGHELHMEADWRYSPVSMFGEENFSKK